MPAFIENKLKSEYGEHSPIVYATMNKLGYMHGNKETKKGEKVEKEYEAKVPHQVEAIKKNIK